ncbi:MDR family MFS transporter [Pseudogracilibacillus sp. ICA-222130]|uniref:MDR family MFS transporter n=1 Tax=Pseudogracilibacillus sp. ICA-222130 TaxID=3134655 RepID=UPI0030BE4125
MDDQLKRPFILAAVMLGMFLSAIEATIVATAMPSIVADLQHFSLYSWVFSAYLLSSSATVLLFGKLADMYGRKPIYLFGISIFLIGSLFAGFSVSMWSLIGWRFIQGIGAGAMMPIATTIVGDIYSKEERAKIQGYLSSVWGISAIIGPLIGAFFVDFLNWQYVFWMNIPIGLLSMLGIGIFLKETKVKEKQSVDLFGTISMMIGITLFMYILVEGGNSLPWNSVPFYLVLGGSIVALSMFFMKSKKRNSMIAKSIWSYKTIRLANIATFITGIIMISVSSYLPTFVQGVLGKSALIAGFTLTTMSIGWPIASALSGRLLLKIGYRTTTLIGGLFLIIGTILFICLPIGQSIWIASFGSFFVGVGMGFTSTAFIVQIQSTVAWKDRGSATASNTFMRSLGSAVGVALFGGILNNEINRQTMQSPADEQLSVDDVDLLLQEDKMASLSKEAIHILQNGLSNGLQYIYVGIFILAIITLICIYLLPKKEES